MDDISKFFESLTVPIVCCNIMEDLESGNFSRSKLKAIKKSIIVEVNGALVGITGYINSEAKVSICIYKHYWAA